MKNATTTQEPTVTTPAVGTTFPVSARVATRFDGTRFSPMDFGTVQKWSVLVDGKPVRTGLRSKGAATAKANATVRGLAAIEAEAAVPAAAIPAAAVAAKLGREAFLRGERERADAVPAGACPRCGGWTTFGGMAHHAHGPAGCTCHR